MASLPYRLARAIIPEPLRLRAMSIRAWPRTAKVAADVASFRSVRRLENRRTSWREDVRVVDVRVRPLAGKPVALRPNTADKYALRDTFVGAYHLPPTEIGSDLRRIWDLGANIGLTMADMAVRYPKASLVGVELDVENAALAESNLRPWADRCRLINAAVWSEDGYVAYSREPGNEQGFHVTDRGTADNSPMARALSLNRLLLEDDKQVVDFVKMDIEGAEEQVLSVNTDWASRVRAISVEVHGPFTVDACKARLASLGFRATEHPRHPAAVVGVRDSLPFEL